MTESEAIDAKLADIHEQLLALPDDAFKEKYALLKRQDRLREEASQHSQTVDEGRTDRDLLAELAGMRSQMHQIKKMGWISSVSPVSVAPRVVGG